MRAHESRMLRKTAAVLLFIGLCTPHSCDVRPIGFLVPTGDNLPWGFFLAGIPVLAALVYVAFALLPPATRWIRAHGAAVRGVASGIFHLVALGYLVMEYLDSRDKVDVRAWTFLVLALVWSSGLIFWSRRRGEKADQAPLVLLAMVGLPVLFFFSPSGLEPGGWILTTGYLLAVLAEIRELLLLPLRNGPPPFASDRAPG